MRKLWQFSARDWLRAAPIQYAAKQLRNDAWLAVYKRRRPRALAPFLEETARFRRGNIALVVAFEQPWALDLLLRMAERNLTDTRLLVFDNSRRAGAREEIQRVCRDRGAPYLPLPPNRTRHINRSHGMAMTWIFHNVVCAIQPRLFAFLDHDLVPLHRIALAQRLGEQPFFGGLHASAWAWSLWAGYCVYDFPSVARHPLNFLYDFSLGLDTGGRNWAGLYRRYDRKSLEHAGSAVVSLRDPVTEDRHRVTVIDHTWLHISGLTPAVKAQLCEHLSLALDHGASWGALLERDAEFPQRV